MEEFDVRHEENSAAGSISTDNGRLVGGASKFNDTDGVVFAFLYE